MANRIKEFRESQGLTLEQLGERIGADRTTVWKLETGKRKLAAAHRARPRGEPVSLPYRLRLGRGLGVTPARLIDDTPEVLPTATIDEVIDDAVALELGII